MIEIKEVDKTYFPLYDDVPQNVEIKSEYHVHRVDNGLGGFVFEEVPVTPHIKDLSRYERAIEYEQMFDISNWRFYMAFDGELPVGAMTIECQNNNVTACRFYKKQGALLSKIDMHAYDSEPGIENEVQFIWYLDL